jgi:putative membrane protein
MKRALLLTAAAATALSLAACNRKAGNTEADNMAAANTMAPSESQPLNKAQDTMGGAVGALSAATLAGRDTGAFVDNAVQGNMYEVQAGKIAQQKAQSPDVKAFGKQMVTDHTAMTNQMQPAVAKSGKTPPTDLDQRRKGFIDNLNAAQPADFDKTYIDQQVSAHQETLTMLNGYAQNGDNADLKAAAAKAAPKVQAHLDRAKALQAQLGGGAAGGNATQ